MTQHRVLALPVPGAEHVRALSTCPAAQAPGTQASWAERPARTGPAPPPARGRLWFRKNLLCGPALETQRSAGHPDPVKRQDCPRQRSGQGHAAGAWWSQPHRGRRRLWGLRTPRPRGWRQGQAVPVWSGGGRRCLRQPPRRLRGPAGGAAGPGDGPAPVLPEGGFLPPTPGVPLGTGTRSPDCRPAAFGVHLCVPCRPSSKNLSGVGLPQA